MMVKNDDAMMENNDVMYDGENMMTKMFKGAWG